MDRYIPKVLRPWALASLLLRGLIRLLERWPLFLLAALFVSPVVPVMRIQYHYLERGSAKIMLDCDYLGPQGMIKYQIGTRCPFIAIVDTRQRAGQ